MKGEIVGSAVLTFFLSSFLYGIFRETELERKKREARDARTEVEVSCLLCRVCMYNMYIGRAVGEYHVLEAA